MAHRIVSILSVAAAIAGVTSPANAQTPAESLIVMGAPAANADQDMISVQTGDLSMATPAGRRALMHRVNFAVETLCGSIAVTDPVAELKCNNSAWAKVRPQLDTAFRR